MSNWQRPSAKHCDTGACVEVAPCESAHCVELKLSDAFTDMVVVRSSLRPEDTILVTKAEMSAFIQAVKDGEYDGYIL